MTRQPKPAPRDQRPRPEPPIDETDLADDIMGDNALQGDDQASVHNERHAVPGAHDADDDLMDTFEKTDKDVRAERDLGKGRRSSGGSADRERGTKKE